MYVGKYELNSSVAFSVYVIAFLYLHILVKTNSLMCHVVTAQKEYGRCPMVLHNDIFLVSPSDIRSGVPERRSKSFNYICGKCLFDTFLTIYRHTFYIE